MKQIAGVDHKNRKSERCRELSDQNNPLWCRRQFCIRSLTLCEWNAHCGGYRKFDPEHKPQHNAQRDQNDRGNFGQDGNSQRGTKLKRTSPARFLGEAHQHKKRYQPGSCERQIVSDDRRIRQCCRTAGPQQHGEYGRTFAVPSSSPEGDDQPRQCGERDNHKTAKKKPEPGFIAIPVPEIFTDVPEFLT